MSTHKTQCVVCGEDVYCYDDVHALSSGGKHGEGGCDNPPYIEFCSLEHALELQARLTRSIANYLSLSTDVLTDDAALRIMTSRRG